MTNTILWSLKTRNVLGMIRLGKIQSNICCRNLVQIEVKIESIST